LEIIGSIKHDRQHQIGVGEGMNSEVFKAHDPQLGGEFAVKVIEKSKFGGDITKYFEEAQAMFANAHCNIVPIQYACETATHIMLAMPYYSRGSLAARISSGPITATELIRVAVGVLNGVSQIHHKGYIHFDIKPSNVLFNDMNDPLVSDFGQTRRFLPGGAVAVPQMYCRAMPPETLSSGVGSLLGDIYQLGLLLYRAVNGDAMYEDQFAGIDWSSTKRLIASGKLPDRKRFLPHVPKRIRSIIRKALNPNPADRYQSAEEFSKAIARVPVGLDWNTTIHPTGEISWYAARSGKSDLEVQLANTAKGWNVRVSTVNGASRRATGGATLNQSGLRREAAIKHLNEVFAQLA
jgi:eukaryotic-like serine/threonine-protein kinase